MITKIAYFISESSGTNVKLKKKLTHVYDICKDKGNIKYAFDLIGPDIIKLFPDYELQINEFISKMLNLSNLWDQYNAIEMPYSNEDLSDLKHVETEINELKAEIEKYIDVITTTHYEDGKRTGVI